MVAPSEDYEALPFAPGTSPFHIKGVAYRAHVDYANACIPGGEQAILDAIRSPALRAFFDQRFLAATKYDVLPLIPVWYVCARLLQQTPAEFLKVRTRHQATSDINGVYKVLLKLASAEAVALRMPRLVAQYFDFVTTEASVVRPGVVGARATGMPLYVMPWFRIVAETYTLVALELAGAKNAKIIHLPTEPAGRAHGLPVVTVKIEIHL